MKEYTFSSKIQKFYCYDLSKNWGIIWNSWLVTLKVPNSSYFNFYQMLKSGYIVLNLSNLQGFIKENQMGKKISKLSKDSLVKIFICAMHAYLLSCFSYVWLCYPTDCITIGRWVNNFSFPLPCLAKFLKGKLLVHLSWLSSDSLGLLNRVSPQTV